MARRQHPITDPVKRQAHIEKISKIVYTPEETREQHEWIAGAMAARMTTYAITQQAKDKFGIGASRVRNLMARVLEKWKLEDEQNRSSLKAKAVRSLEQDMTAVRAELANNISVSDKAKLHSTLTRYHALLADIQGTREPIKVDVDVRVSQSIVGVIANLSPEQVQAYVQRRKQLEQEAEHGRLLTGPAAAE